MAFNLLKNVCSGARDSSAFQAIMKLKAKEEQRLHKRIISIPPPVASLFVKPTTINELVEEFKKDEREEEDEWLRQLKARTAQTT